MLDKKNESKPIENTSSMSLENRKLLSLTGVNEVISFDDEKISLKTNLGALLIKGSGLKMNKLDVQNGEVIIGGYISNINYLNKKNKVKRGRNLISKIFK
ncbi:sporulation protein YabP [Clostridium sp. B9]|uniref:sporulation protein YabP n=1 Tax=Clostridium sp. B9 TaxID=3423224 RepID=UPI003D2EE4F1